MKKHNVVLAYVLGLLAVVMFSLSSLSVSASIFEEDEIRTDLSLIDAQQIDDNTPLVSVSDLDLEIRPMMDGDISKNAKRTNYKITSGWYYGYTLEFSTPTPYISISRTYDVYFRNVEYDMEYDVYNKYTGRFLRHVKMHVRGTEEEWRLKK